MNSPKPWKAKLLVYLTGWKMVTVLLIIHWLLAVSSVLNKSETYDETAHITAGYLYWLGNDFRLQPENGNLPQRLSALPLVLGDFSYPSFDEKIWGSLDANGIGHHFFYKKGNNLLVMLLLSRGFMALAGVGLCLLVWYWSRRLFSPIGAMISLLLCVFSPTILANSRLATSDITFTFFLLASLACLWWVLHRMTPFSLLLSSVIMAFAFLSKMSVVVIIPAGAALVFLRLFSKYPLFVSFRRDWTISKPLFKVYAYLAALFVHVLVVWLVIWVFYGCRYSALNTERLPTGNLQISWDTLQGEKDFVEEVINFSRRNKLLPEAYMYGFNYVYVMAKARSMYINGEVDVDGKWYFFPFSFLVKTPIAFIILGLLILASILYYSLQSKVQNMDRKRLIAFLHPIYESIPLIFLFLAYSAFSIQSSLNIGHRHILPLYPILFILAGSIPLLISNKVKSISYLIAALVIHYIGTSCWIYPHYLSFFNIVYGGPTNGYHLLVDSSLDWGQDLPALKNKLDQIAATEKNALPVYLSYFGTANPAYYGIQCKSLPGFLDQYRKKEMFELNPGVYCISASMLQGAYLRTPKPWSEKYKKMYDHLRSDLPSLLRRNSISVLNEQLSRKYGTHRFNELYLSYEELRLASVCAHLSKRVPDYFAGYSILIYMVDEEELHDALK